MCTKNWLNKLLLVLYFVIVLNVCSPAIAFIATYTILQKITTLNGVWQILLSGLVTYHYFKDWMKVRSYFYKIDNECMKFFRN